MYPTKTNEMIVQTNVYRNLPPFSQDVARASFIKYFRQKEVQRKGRFGVSYRGNIVNTQSHILYRQGPIKKF